MTDCSGKAPPAATTAEPSARCIGGDGTYGVDRCAIAEGDRQESCDLVLISKVQLD